MNIAATISADQLTKPEYCIFIRRYDKPEVMYGVHHRSWSEEYEDYAYTQPVTLMPKDDAVAYWAQMLKNGGYRIVISENGGQIKWAEMDEEMQHLVQNCCPIGFHPGLAENDPAVTERITVLVRENQP